MRKFKRLTMTLALLIMAVGGAWAGETPLLTIENKDYPSFKSGSQTFDDMVTVTFSNPVYNDGDSYGWYANSPSLLTVAGINGYTITSCKFYTGYGIAADGYTVAGESPSVYLLGAGVYKDDSQSEYLGSSGVKKIEVYGSKPEPTEWALTPDETGKTWTLAEMPASNIELQVEYEPTKVTMDVNDKTMGTLEVAGQSIVEWTAETWKGWTSSTKEYTVDDITMTSSQSAHIREYASEDEEYNHSLFFFVRKMVDDDIVTFSTTGDPFSRIEFTMIGDYSDWNPSILPVDNWTFEGKSAVWEGEATKSLTLQSCSTNVSKITFFKGAAIPAGVTVNTDGTFTVAKTATVTLKATPAEGYKFLYWEDDQNNTNPVREVTIESGMADMTYKAVFAEILYNVTFADGIEEADKWKAEPNAAAKNTEIKVTYSGSKKVIDVTVKEKKAVTSKLASEVTSDDIFKVIASDGMIYDNIAAAESAGTVAQGLVVYVGSGTGNDTYTHGMALALKDEGNYTWSGAKNACNAKNTSTPIVGALWIQASKDQWNTMFNAVGGDCKLRDCFASAGGTNLKKVENYWAGSSHEDSGEQGDYYTFSDSNLSGSWCSTSVIYNNPYLVRPCIVF